MYRRKKWQGELRKHKKKEAGAVVYAAVPFCLFYTVCTLVWYKGSFMFFWKNSWYQAGHGPMCLQG